MFSHQPDRGLLPSVAVARSLSCLAFAGAADARIVRIIVDTTISPAFNGQSFGAVRQDETLAALIAQARASNVCTFGAAHQSCDPAAP